MLSSSLMKHVYNNSDQMKGASTLRPTMPPEDVVVVIFVEGVAVRALDAALAVMLHPSLATRVHQPHRTLMMAPFVNFVKGIATWYMTVGFVSTKNMLLLVMVVHGRSRLLLRNLPRLRLLHMELIQIGISIPGPRITSPMT